MSDIIQNLVKGSLENKQAPSVNEEVEYIKRKVRHKQAVAEIVASIKMLIDIAVASHDNDKLFPEDYPGDWDHKDGNRHHWLCTHPEDMTLIDLIEMIGDVVAAFDAKGGSAEVPMRDDLLENEFLCSVIVNTVNVIRSDVPVTFHKYSTYE